MSGDDLAALLYRLTLALRQNSPPPSGGGTSHATPPSTPAPTPSRAPRKDRQPSTRPGSLMTRADDDVRLLLGRDASVSAARSVFHRGRCDSAGTAELGYCNSRKAIAAERRASLSPAGDCESGGPEWEFGAAAVDAPVLCLCTTMGLDGLTARLLVVRSESACDAFGARPGRRRSTCSGTRITRRLRR